MGLSVAGEGVKAEPNVVPMIDVMLVLLIIFMVVTPALAQGFKATPPEGINIKTHPEEDSDQVLGVAVDGSFWLNKRPIAEDTLDETIKRIYDARTVDKILYIKADKDLKFKFVAKAMDIAAKNGVRVVGAVSDQKMGTQSTVAGDVIDPNKK
jgi:biopolymer transport protein TolR